MHVSLPFFNKYLAGFVGVEVKMVCRKRAVPIYQISSNCAGYHMVNMLVNFFHPIRDILTC